jgi:metallophosphoesterase superfamily enzyme
VLVVPKKCSNNSNNSNKPKLCKEVVLEDANTCVVPRVRDKVRVKVKVKVKVRVKVRVSRVVVANAFANLCASLRLKVIAKPRVSRVVVVADVILVVRLTDADVKYKQLKKLLK